MGKTRRINVKGDKELVNKLSKLNKDMRGRVLQNAVRAGALPIQNYAVLHVPVVTGNLRRSIHTEIVNASDTHVEAQIGTDVEYAPHVEFGTRKGQVAKPYLRPAFDTQSGAAQKEIIAALKDQLP